MKNGAKFHTFPLKAWLFIIGHTRSKSKRVLRTIWVNNIKKTKQTSKQWKHIASGALNLISDFLINFWVYHHFYIFDVSGSLIQSKTMSFYVFDILKHHRSDPWWNVETWFFFTKIRHMTNDQQFSSILKSSAIKRNPNFNLNAENKSSNIVLLGK